MKDAKNFFSVILECYSGTMQMFTVRLRRRIVDVLKRDLAVLEKSLLAVSDVLPERHIDPFYFSIDKLYYSIVQNIRILFYGVV